MFLFEITNFFEKEEDIGKPLEKKKFRLPITYLEKKDLHELSETVSNDLEMVSSNSTKSMYEYLFQPNHEFAKKMILEWNKQYTTNIDYLKDTKEVLENMEKYCETMPSYSVNCEKIKEIWKETKENKDFLSKYSYMEWNILKHFNHSSTFLQTISFIHIVSPLVSLMIPFLFLLFPFIILKIQGIPITFEVYMDVLKTIARNHFIGKTLSNMNSFSVDKVLYFMTTFGLYLLQIYQNAIQCHHFYKNMRTMNDYLFEMKEYTKYSILSMEEFLELNRGIQTYQDFLHDVELHCENLKRFYSELANIQPFCHSLSKFNEMGYLLKCYYELNSNMEYEEALEFSFGFEGFIDNLKGVSENLNKHIVSYAEFDVSGNCDIQKQYYPPFMEENPVKNNCSFDKNMILSSPNAGGKTTLIKTTTLNIIFSQQIGCGFYKSCVLNPYTHIHSYLNIPDTSGRDSLFQAESRRCKEILDIIHQYSGEPYRHFCIFDELYSGTNPVEATKSAYAFLLYLCKFSNVQFILTTHYISICKKFRLSSNVQNYKMEVENLEDGSIRYTYKMKKGISKIQGAIKILKQMEYPEEIIETIRNTKA